MEFRRLEGAKRVADFFMDGIQQFWRNAGRLKPGQREVGSERAFFQGEAEAVYGLVNFRGKGFQIGGSFHASPEDAGAFLIREKAQAAEVEIHEFEGTDGREDILERAQF